MDSSYTFPAVGTLDHDELRFAIAAAQFHWFGLTVQVRNLRQKGLEILRSKNDDSHAWVPTAVKAANRSSQKSISRNAIRFSGSKFRACRSSTNTSSPKGDSSVRNADSGCMAYNRPCENYSILGGFCPECPQTLWNRKTGPSRRWERASTRQQLNR